MMQLTEPSDVDLLAYSASEKQLDDDGSQLAIVVVLVAVFAVGAGVVVIILIQSRRARPRLNENPPGKVRQGPTTKERQFLDHKEQQVLAQIPGAKPPQSAPPPFRGSISNDFERSTHFVDSRRAKTPPRMAVP
jgi:hypothetical protein